MTDEENLTKVNNKNKEQETIESDIEDEEESACSNDNSNITTDDEFYDELMSAPVKLEDHLIPADCNDEIIGIDSLTSCLNRRYNSCPIVFTGTLKDAIKEAFNSKDIPERRPLLIYINNDKSIYSNLFCKQLLCHEKIIDYLLNNYVLWAWDVTFESNGIKLNEIYKAAFSQWNVEQQIGTKSTEHYPLLIGIFHNPNGDYSFKYLIHGSEKQPVVDEFLGRLIQHKDQFEFSEENFEREKTRQQQMNSLVGTPNFPPHPSKFLTNHDFSHSTPMHYNRNPIQFPQFLSNDNNRLFPNSRTFLPLFQQMNIRPDDEDDKEEEDDDDDDDDGKTPTIDYHPLPKFPKE